MTRNPGRKAPAPRREQRHWLRLALSSIADAVLIADRDSRVVFLNPAAESLTGWPQKDAKGTPLDAVFRIVDRETRQPAESPGARALRQGSAAGSVDPKLLITKDGTERPIELSAAPFRDAGGIAGVALVFRDMTERRKNEQALRQSEERFRLLVEGVKDYAIFMLTPQGHVASWNAGAELIKGYRADQIIGKHFSCFYPADALERGWPQSELEMAAAEGRLEDEGWRIRQDGSRFWANVVITALRDGEGRLVGFSKVTRDLTERQRAEAELRAAQVQAAALEEVNRRKDEFLAMLGHELRNPLAPILNAVHLLALQPGSADPIQERARIMIERQVGQLSRLVDDLLEVSRIGRGLIRLEPEDVDLREVVGRALDSTRPLLEQRRHELISNWPLEPIWVHGDPTRLEQVVLNLLNNAAKYTEEGGRIAVGVAQEGSRAVVRVKDNGVGIPRDLLPRIFELFTQAERSLDRAQGGLGIGLTLVQKLVELHGGSVEAHSQPGEGSEFVVSLPLVADPTRQAQSPVTGPAVGPARALRVLVVDDNVDQAESMAMLLRADGQEVRVVYSGSHALETAVEYRPQVVLLDIGLPEIDGYEVARRLRRDPLFERLPLIAMTGYGQDTDRQRSLEAGFDHHLVKPADPQRLRELLEQLAAEAD